MAEFLYELRIPRDRIAVLIGKKGDVKRDIEDSTHTKLEIDSKEGDVFLKGEDALGLFSAREVVKAIGRGFNPDIALLLLKPDYAYEVIPLNDYVKGSKNTLIRIKGRVIGKEGKARAVIEELTECRITVYGKTIGIIGLAGNTAIARRAIEALITGSRHANVYKWLERKRREMKSAEMAI
ncbi:MAG TPA: KH domain-containing protein [Candidatus Nanoarchaeia archaeon]|nr:KH domain-containing protein [Candidatus Nanoarchaeia archaeon]